jgi:hypothetical protein
MSSDSQEATSAPLSDEQRLALLEKDRRLDRIILLVMAALLAILLASWLTWGLMGFLGEEEEAIGSSQVEALQKQLVTLETQVANQELQWARLDSVARSQPGPSAPNGDNRESRQQLAGILLAQEQSFQHSLAALKTGMRDLAGMIAGSRSWLADYNEALDKSLAESQARERKLQQWASNGGAATASP